MFDVAIGVPLVTVGVTVLVGCVEIHMFCVHRRSAGVPWFSLRKYFCRLLEVVCTCLYVVGFASFCRL